MRYFWRILPLALFIAIGLPLAFATCGVDRDQYVGLNEALLRTLPVVPGAQLVSVESSPYHFGDSALSGADGYTTSATYRAPPTLSVEDLLEFYIDALGGEWLVRLQTTPVIRIGTGEQVGEEASASFTRHPATVSLDPGNLNRIGQFTIGVDHRGVR